MDRPQQISILKHALLKDVASLFRRTDVKWRVAIAMMIRELRSAAGPAVIFGGTLRSLMLGRLAASPRFGRPRDLDIVVSGTTVDSLKAKLHEHVVRQTRFGGLQLERNNWHFDVWPLEKTWALVHDQSLETTFRSLPSTTFFNLEAIAVDVWADPGRGRAIYSGNDQFFDGLLDRTIEINREENPFPALCVVRSLVLASSTNFWLGPRLSRYLSMWREMIADSELEGVQQQHYGAQRISLREMRRCLDHVATEHERKPQSRIKLPPNGQLRFWDDDEDLTPRMFVHVADGKPMPIRGQGGN